MGVSWQVCVALCLWPARPVAADSSTPLLEDDLRANKRKTIDTPKDSLDADLDAALGGPQGFSTQALAAVEDRLRAELRRDRPRASPRLVVFLYPGRVSAERLKAMREVNVDIELTIDPCSRSLCDDALGKHLELVGRAVGEPMVRGQGFSIVYKTLTLKAETDVRGDEIITLTVPVADAIAASKRPGGGAAIMAARKHADTDYVPLMTKAIAQKAGVRRVPLAGPPAVSRGAGGVEVSLKLHADRSRQEQQLLDALAATGEALRSSTATPSSGRILVTAEGAGRGSAPAQFRCPLEPASLYSQGKLDGKSLLSSYVEKVVDDKSAQRMDLDSGPGGDEGGPAPDDNEAISVIGSSFSSLGACAKTEAARNPKFRGVTIVIGWAPSGRAASVDVKEPALKTGPLPGCLRSAFESIHLPRFSGGTRTIEFPIRLK
jgi:hypothetical protein